MELSTWLLYVSFISVLIFSPGPSALLCVSDGLKFGKRKSTSTIIGGAIASLVLLSVSAIGLGAILVASKTLFFSIKIIGALYLIYLGWESWCHGSIKVKEDAGTKNDKINYSFYILFRKGFIVGISNPKDLLFFIALFPSFMNASLPQLDQYLVLAGTWVFIDFTSMFMYTSIGSKIKPWLSKTTTMNLVNRVIGGVFVVLGSALAISTGVSKKL